MIPSDAEKPADPRREKKLKTPEESLSFELVHLLEAALMPMPNRNPDAILNIVKEERARRQFEAELAYLRGDFARVMHCFDKTGGKRGGEAARLPCGGRGDCQAWGTYPAYLKIESYLKDSVKAGKGGFLSVFAELTLASVYVSASAPKTGPRLA